MTTKFKTNDYIQLNHYCLVTKVGNDITYLKDCKTGFEFQAIGQVQDKMLSCSNYEKEEIVCRTTLADKLINSNKHIFTVVFTKKDGSKKTLRGHFLYIDKMMGRSVVWDLENDGQRQIDHRTIEELIIDGVHYKLK